MALEQRNTSRVLARVGTWCKAAVFHVADVIQSLLNFREQDELRVKGAKTADFAIRRVLYLIADYWLWVLQASIALAMKTLGFSLWEMFLALWVYDFVAAGFFVVIYEVTGKDLSLGEDFRRAVDTIHGKSKVAGVLAATGVIILAVAWTGPEKVIMFARKEIYTIRELLVVLTVLTAAQSFMWAVLYSLAYDFTVQLLS